MLGVEKKNELWFGRRAAGCFLSGVIPSPRPREFDRDGRWLITGYRTARVTNEDEFVPRRTLIVLSQWSASQGEARHARGSESTPRAPVPRYRYLPPKRTSPRGVQVSSRVDAFPDRPSFTNTVRIYISFFLSSFNNSILTLIIMKRKICQSPFRKVCKICLLIRWVVIIISFRFNLNHKRGWREFEVPFWRRSSKRYWWKSVKNQSRLVLKYVNDNRTVLNTSRSTKSDNKKWRKIRW